LGSFRYFLIALGCRNWVHSGANGRIPSHLKGRSDGFDWVRFAHGASEIRLLGVPQSPASGGDVSAHHVPPLSPGALRDRRDVCAARLVLPLKMRVIFYFRSFARCAIVTHDPAMGNEPFTARDGLGR
jgi:hypothetical protein